MDQLRPFAGPTIASAVGGGLWAALSQPLAPGWAAAPPPHPSVSYLWPAGLSSYQPACGFAAGFLCQNPAFWQYSVVLLTLGVVTTLAFGLGLQKGASAACWVLGWSPRTSFRSRFQELRVAPHARAAVDAAR